MAGKKHPPRTMSQMSFGLLADEIEELRARIAAIQDKLEHYDVDSLEVKNHRSGDNGLQLLAAFVEAAEHSWRDVVSKL